MIVAQFRDFVNNPSAKNHALNTFTYRRIV
jgi:hypothetical protein